MKSVIVIPARYGSTRFPGKPLVEIAGKTMLHRVCEIAIAASKNVDCEVIVATEDDRIKNYVDENLAEQLGVKCMMTSDNCKTGSDRVRETVQKLDYKPDFILNLQGDAPLTPPWFLEAMIKEFQTNPTFDIVTPGFEMPWDDLDRLRENKKTTPFSGTTIVLDRRNNNAIWFSKNILPAIRKEEKHRAAMENSPVMRHVGLYGYTYDMLMDFGKMDEGFYEKFEGLEQLRALENGYTIRVAKVSYKGRPSSSGVDSPQDVGRTEAIIEKFGELV